MLGITFGLKPKEEGAQYTDAPYSNFDLYHIAL